MGVRANSEATLPMVDSETIATIRHRLSELEQAENVQILYAVESGSRAWGFPSRDSDYDIRFIYAHPREWYLSVNLESKRDVIERPLQDELDFAGWDLRKALKLFAKSNPPLFEWLDSSITYLDRFRFADRVRALRAAFFSAHACAYHYLHMAEGNYRAYLRESTVWVKKYFYVLRPLFAVRWIEQGRGVVPMPFASLLETVADQRQLVDEINRLLQRKIGGEEMDEGPSIPVIQHFIESELTRLESLKLENVRSPVDFEQLNCLFRSILADIAASTDR
jgi:predicted nucleotidyltransferase